MGVRFSPMVESVERVYVPVPADRVDDVFRFLLGLADEEGAVDSDLERRVNRVYRESDEQFRRLLRFLAEHPGEPLSTERTAEAIELERGTASLAGMLGAFGRRSNNRYQGFWPFEKLHNPTLDQSELEMPLHIAAIVRRLDETQG